MYKNSNVLVAGGTGMIGIPLVKELLAKKARITVVSLDTEKYAKKIFGKEIIYKRLDLTDLKNCKTSVKNQDYVFNLLGIKGSVGIGEKKVASYLVPMLRFQTNLMESAFNAKIKRFLFVGSICSYPRGRLHIEDNVWNGIPKQNDRIPGIAKRVGELLSEAYSLEYGWDAVRIVRPSNVYGPYDNFNPLTGQVIPSLICKAFSKENSLKVWGNGSAKRDFVYSEDVAKWIIYALEHAPHNIPINLGYGKAVTIKKLAITIRDIINPNMKIEWDKSKPTGDPCRLLSVDRAKKLLNYRPNINLYDGLIKTIDWYKRNKKL